MDITRDQNNNVAYSFGRGENNGRDVISYWTVERKRRATPVLPGMRNGGGPANGPATDPQLADLSRMPFITGGKLYYSMDGTDFVASASIFERTNLLLTAAHCIQNKNTGNLGEKYLFERCHQGESASEQLTFRTVAVKEFWYSEKKSKWDYSIVILDQDAAVDTPLKYSLEGIADKTVTAFGYPTNYYNGDSMVYITGTPVRGADSTWLIGGCKMRKGASGGAWVLEDGQTVVGVNAFIASPATASYLGSPIFDENFESLYQYVLTLLKEK